MSKKTTNKKTKKANDKPQKSLTKKKKVIIISSIIAVLILSVIIVCLVVKQNQPELEGGWREVPEKVNDYDYGYDIKDDYEYKDEDGHTYTVIDILTLFKEKPSLTIETGNRENEMKDTFDHIFDDINKYKQPFLTKEEIEEMEKYTGEEWGGMAQIDVGASFNKYSPTDTHVNDFYIRFNSSENSFIYELNPIHYPQDEAFWQLCYDTIVSIMEELETPEARWAAIAVKTNYVDTTALRQAVFEKDYRLVLDAIVNDLIAIAYTDSNGVFTRVEAAPMTAIDEAYEGQEIVGIQVMRRIALDNQE